MQQQKYDLAHTAFFPVTGNPIGFHHLLLADAALRQFSQIQTVVFLLSNGKHPDPTKAKAIAPQTDRMELLQESIDSFPDPTQSQVALLAQQEEFPLFLNLKRGQVSNVEFQLDRPVPLRDHVRALLQSSATPEADRVRLIIGGDLIDRMENPNIFSDSDLQVLSQQVEFFTAPREGHAIATTLKKLDQVRGFRLFASDIDLSPFPKRLQPFFQLSSTAIRHAAQSRHGLNCFLPTSAANQIEQKGMYQERDLPFQEWEIACSALRRELEEQARQLKQQLDKCAEAGHPHTLAIVEASVGGLLASVMTALPGVSQHFLSGSVVYDQPSKEQMLGKPWEQSAVSVEMAEALAEAFREKVGADWVLAETGMAGPIEGIRRSQKNGQCHIALASAQGTRSMVFKANPFLSKKEHQLHFAMAALEFLEKTIEG